MNSTAIAAAEQADSPTALAEQISYPQAELVINDADARNAELARREAVILGTEHAFWSKGRALREIRDQQLYCAKYASYDAYLRLRWGFSPRYAQYHVRAADAMDVLDANNCSPLPKTESQARPLSKLEPEDVCEVWQLVLSRAKKAPDGSPLITAKLVREVVAEWLGEDEQLEVDPVDVVLAEVAVTASEWQRRLPQTRDAYEALAKELRRVAREMEWPIQREAVADMSMEVSNK